MKVAYIFATNMASTFKLSTMILPQLEAGNHGADVVGMFFFDDNIFVLRNGDPIGERLSALAKNTGMLLMMGDVCALERNLAQGEPRWCDREGKGRNEPGEIRTIGTVEGVQVGCFPDLYSALADNLPDQVITL